MTTTKYRVSDRPQRQPGALGDDRDWFAPGTEVRRIETYPLDPDGEWRVEGDTLPGRGGIRRGYILPSALDPIIEPESTPNNTLIEQIKYVLSLPITDSIKISAIADLING